MMTYDEVINFAREHYSEGGNGIFECLSYKDYERNVAEGEVYTKQYLLTDFETYRSVCQEYEGMANW